MKPTDAEGGTVGCSGLVGPPLVGWHIEWPDGAKGYCANNGVYPRELCERLMDARRQQGASVTEHRSDSVAHFRPRRPNA